MIKRKLATVATVGLGLFTAACAQDPVKDAEAQAAIVEQRGSNKDVRDARRKVADAYLQKKDGKGYELAKLTADVACLSADMDPDEPFNDTLAARYQAIEPDNMETMADTVSK